MDRPAPEAEPPKLSLEDFAWLWVAGFFAMLAAASTCAVLEVDSDLVLRAALKPLFPGIFVAAHVFREGHDRQAILIGALANAIVYGTLVIVGRLLWRGITDERSLQPPKQRDI